MQTVLLLCLATASCIFWSPVTAQSSEGTFFAVALPRTGDDFDGLIRLTAKTGAAVTIESATESREITVPADSATTEFMEPAQRVSFGTENKGVIITSDQPISVHLDQPSWELDVGMARPVDAENTEFYILSYLGDATTASLFPLGFFIVVASEDETTVVITDDEGDETTVQLNMFDTYTEDANEAINGANLDYTGRYITSDKPISVFAGHGRVLFPGNNNNQYIFDSMPNNQQLGTSYTTFPVGFGPDDSGYMLRVLAATDGTEVTIADLGVSETLNAGEYYQLQHDTSYNSFKVECSIACSVLQLTVATINSGGDYDTSMGGGMISLTPDSAYSMDLLVATPYLNAPENNYVMLALVVNTYPVGDVLVNGENVNDVSTWYPGTNDEYAFATVFIEQEDAMIRITTDNEGEAFAGYIYSNVNGGAWGTKAYSAGYGQ